MCPSQLALQGGWRGLKERVRFTCFMTHFTSSRMQVGPFYVCNLGFGKDAEKMKISFNQYVVLYKVN